MVATLTVENDLRAVHMMRRLQANFPDSMFAIGTEVGDVMHDQLTETIKKESKRSSGALGESYEKSVKREPDGATTTLASDSVYAAITDKGGTIRPRRGQWLAIPLNKNARKRWPRDWAPGALFRPGRARILLDTAGGRPQYALARQVTIPAKNYTRKAFAEARSAITGVVKNELTEMLRKSVREAERL